jgi:uncharacterized protein
MSDNKILVIYHSNCPDGFASSWACWEKFQNTADYLAVGYYDKAPDVTAYDQIYVVDFSFAREILLEWHDSGKQVTVLDHHKSAKEQLEGLDFAYFNMDECGAVMTWKYLHPETNPPEVLQYVQDRDLWQWRLPLSREVNAALSQYTRRGSIPEDFKAYQYKSIGSLAKEGTIILECQNNLVTAMTASDRVITCLVGGHMVHVVNASCLISEVCERLYSTYTEDPFVACFFDIEYKQVWALRTNKDFDVSAVAKQFGGGGHAKAAGFKVGTGQIRGF